MVYNGLTDYRINIIMDERGNVWQCLIDREFSFCESQWKFKKNIMLTIRDKCDLQTD